MQTLFTQKFIDIASYAAPSQFIRNAPAMAVASARATLQGESYETARAATAKGEKIASPLIRGSMFGAITRGAINAHTHLTAKVAGAGAYGLLNAFSAPGKFNLPVPAALANVAWLPATGAIAAYMATAEAAVYGSKSLVDGATARNWGLSQIGAGLLLGATLVMAEPYRLATSCLWATVEGAALAVGAFGGLVSHVWSALREPTAPAVDVPELPATGADLDSLPSTSEVEKGKQRAAEPTAGEALTKTKAALAQGATKVERDVKIAAEAAGAKIEALSEDGKEAALGATSTVAGAAKDGAATVENEADKQK